MKLYVVLDTKGDGRLVGVWDSKANAEELVNRYPAYYKLHTVELNKINRNVLKWTDNKEQKLFLQKFRADKITKK
jgi:hypothetical protein